MKTAQVIVTSCSRRELELEQLRDFLRGNGYQVSDDDWAIDKKADLIFLSTCGFTGRAEDFGFETLHRIKREKKPDAGVVMCGCIPEINPARVKAEFNGHSFSPQSYSRVDAIISAQKPFDSFRRPNLLKHKAITSSLRDDFKKGIQLIKAFDGSFAGMQQLIRRVGSGVTRKVIRGSHANLKSSSTWYLQIQEGCSMECSYCSIRTAIGRLRSRPMDSILEDFRSGLAMGFRNFQLTGDNAGSYGLDCGTNMGVLLDAFCAFEDEFSLELTDINPVFLHTIQEPFARLASKGRINRLYVPIQSGSSRILKLMKRGCDMDKVGKMLIDMRNAVSRNSFKMGTSIIVGFPSETNEELQQTISFCKKVNFDWVWCHSFSARPETPAAIMEGQIDPHEILTRANLVKKELSAHSLVSTAEDDVGNRTCQG